MDKRYTQKIEQDTSTDMDGKCFIKKTKERFLFETPCAFDNIPEDRKNKPILLLCRCPKHSVTC